MEKAERKIIIDYGALKLLNSTLGEKVPEGSRLLVLIDRRFDGASRVKSELTKKYFVSEVEIADNSISAIRKIKASEESRAVIAIGGSDAVNAGKFVAKRYSLPLAVVVLSPETVSYTLPSAILEADGFRESYKAVAPFLLLCDGELVSDDERRLASGFGEICARLCTLFDRRALSVLFGERYDEKVEKSLCSAVIESINLALKGKFTPFVATKLALKVSQILASFGSSSLYLGGEMQLENAFRLIKRKNGKEIKSVGENSLITAVLSMKIYSSFLSLPTFRIMRVADNNLRLDKLVSTFGVKASLASQKISPVCSFVEADKLAYALSVNRDELMKKAVVYGKTLKLALSQFKRLYKDCGYSYNNYITIEELRPCVNLAPEMSGKSTLYTVMKRLGVIF